MRRRAGAAWLMVKLAFRADPKAAAAMLALRTVGAVSSTLTAYWLKLLIDGITQQRWAGALAAAVLLGVGYGIIVVTAYSGFRVRIGLEERMGLVLDEHLLQLDTELPGIEHHERPDYKKELDLLTQARVSLTQSPGSVFETFSVVVRIVSAAILLTRIHPVLVLLPAVAGPSLWANGWAARALEHTKDDNAERDRLATKLYDIATSAADGKELRIFGLQDQIVRRHAAVVEETQSRIRATMIRSAFVRMAGWLVFGLGYGGAILFVAWRAANAQASSGDVVMMLNLAGQVNGQVISMAQLVSWMFHTLKAAERYLWLRDYADEQRALTRNEHHPVPERLEHGITFEQVSFRYPGTEAAVLHDVTLHLPAGSTVAIVGENGAGKTTLVKLLCRFYEPTQGRIDIDRVPLQELGPGAWRARMAGGFQDFMKYQVLARHAVGLGHVPDMDADDPVMDALARAGATDVIDDLPHGLTTQLGRYFDNGVELSEGQWQKVALGRAMMRVTPLLLILDEPTSSLDAPTEHSLFERYAGAARDTARRAGAITILVSHRFSTVRMADFIVVVDEGQVTEFGTHGELMRLGGTYAELYELQARGYR